MRSLAVLFLLAAIAAAWWLIGRPQAMPPAPLAAGERVACVSYAPFEGAQSPFDPGLVIPPEQIARQLAALSQVTDCVRTYSVDQGLDQVPRLAREAGLTVLLGLWLGRDPAGNEREIARGIALALAEPEAIAGVVVGNEVLLRGEQTPAALAAILERVRDAVPQPVTYADVWERWLEEPQLAESVDFATIHILPYWEDEPVAVDDAIAHLAAVRRRLGEALAGHEILIGETGWPSAGRQREGAVPAPSSQALYLHGLLTLFAETGWRYNLIEAFDQPWKRALEGTVGGHWGFLDGEARVKFAWGQPVSDHPAWPWQAGLGLLLALLAVGCGWRAPGRRFAAVLAIAAASALALPWWLEQALLASLTLADWVRSLLAVLLALATPPLAARALERGIALPPLAALLGSASPAAGAARLLGWCLALTLLLATPWALALAFDPRYRDFATAALAAPAVALALLPPGPGPRQAETAFALVLGAAALATLANEGLANGQALLWCGTLLLLAANLLRGVRRYADAPATTPPGPAPCRP